MKHISKNAISGEVNKSSLGYKLGYSIGTVAVTCVGVAISSVFIALTVKLVMVLAAWVF